MKRSRILGLAFAIGLAAMSIAGTPAARAESRLRAACTDYLCFLDFEGNCPCEWIQCDDGNYYCGGNY
jgi:hypothetical protein